MDQILFRNVQSRVEMRWRKQVKSSIMKHWRAISLMLIILPFDRVTFLYGLLWEHENLNQLTHERLHEFFGYITSEVASQLALIMRKNKLVSAEDRDIYLPDMDKRLQSSAYKDHMNHLDLPICFIVGKILKCELQCYFSCGCMLSTFADFRNKGTGLSHQN